MKPPDRIELLKDGTHFYLSGVEVTETLYRAIYPLPDEGGGNGNRPWTKPIHSEALAVHPRQIKDVLARNAKYGLNVEYDKKGRPILRDRKQRQRLLQIEGLIDRNAGYGDDHAPSPQSPRPDTSGGPVDFSEHGGEVASLSRDQYERMIAQRRRG
jgi:hypothetical protein